MTEPVSNPYKLPKTCQHSIWDREGCYCNRIMAEMHKVNESETCKKRKAINDYITDMFSGRMRVHGTTHLREKKNNEV